MKARLFNESTPVEEELIFKVYEDGGNIEVELVDRDGSFIQHVFKFGANGIYRYGLSEHVKIPLEQDRKVIRVRGNY